MNPDTRIIDNLYISKDFVYDVVQSRDCIILKYRVFIIHPSGTHYLLDHIYIYISRTITDTSETIPTRTMDI